MIFVSLHFHLPFPRHLWTETHSAESRLETTQSGYGLTHLMSKWREIKWPNKTLIKLLCICQSPGQSLILMSDWLIRHLFIIRWNTFQPVYKWFGLKMIVVYKTGVQDKFDLHGLPSCEIDSPEFIAHFITASMVMI